MSILQKEINNIIDDVNNHLIRLLTTESDVKGNVKMKKKI